MSVQSHICARWRAPSAAVCPKKCKWREGTKGTMQAQVLALRVHWATGSPRYITSHSRVHTGPEG